jgi:hypothetical protein
MVPKWFIYFCIFLFSTIGAYIPILWGGGIFSFSSIMLSGLGAIVGIFVAIRIGK